MRVRVHTSTCARTHIIQVANNCANYSEAVLLGAFVGQVCARAGARARAFMGRACGFCALGLGAAVAAAVSRGRTMKRQQLKA